MRSGNLLSASSSPSESVPTRMGKARGAGRRNPPGQSAPSAGGGERHPRGAPRERGVKARGCCRAPTQPPCSWGGPESFHKNPTKPTPCPATRGPPLLRGRDPLGERSPGSAGETGSGMPAPGEPPGWCPAQPPRLVPHPRAPLAVPGHSPRCRSCRSSGHTTGSSRQQPMVRSRRRRPVCAALRSPESPGPAATAPGPPRARPPGPPRALFKRQAQPRRRGRGSFCAFSSQKVVY